MDIISKSDKQTVTEAMRIMGRAKSPAKTKAARANAKKGGWPKGKKRKPALT